MNKIKLKRCPFCGGEAKQTVIKEDILHVRYWGIRCIICHCGTSGYQDVNKAIEEWNTRKPMESIVNKLDKMIQSDSGGMYDTTYERAYNNGIFDAMELIEKGEDYG